MMSFNKYKLADIAKIEISGVDKKTIEGEIPVRLCNFVDVYYNWAITKEKAKSFMVASAKQTEIDKCSIGKGMVAITKDSETRDDIGVATYIADDFDNVVLGYHCALIIPNSAVVDGKYLNAFMHTRYIQKYFENNASGSGQRYTLSNDTIGNIPVLLPSIDEQHTIGKVLADIDRKIELNKRINDNLEAMAKQLYDYWFVQFDFPNEEGKPYKSSGGAMVWNEELHMNIPYSWNTCLLNDYIGSNKTGDWGFDEPAEKRNMKVGCIRGADIVKLNDLPTRYIKDSNTSKLLSVWDIVIEVSGGSPTQATGRSAFVTPGVLKRNGGNLTCSNFCHAFTMKNYKASAYFFFMWRMFYDNNNMFNYEGKTSGIKNFMTDTFLANKWLDVPTALLDLFFERIKVIYEQIDNNIEEINALTKQRDELLPLLMNGQATINYHLSDD
mgnify:CR=1 FL=1